MTYSGKSALLAFDLHAELPTRADVYFQARSLVLNYMVCADSKDISR